MALDLNDKTANGNTLTNNNSIVESADTPFAASTSSADLEFSSSQFFSALDSASLSITGNLTIELWVKFESLPGSGARSVFVAKQRNSATSHYSYHFGIDNNGGQIRLTFYYSTDDTYQGANDVNANWTPSTATWYHVAIVFTAASHKVQFFVDGVQQGADITSCTGTSIFDNAVKLGIGCQDADNGTGNAFFDGIMDEIRIWNTARTSTELTNNKGVRLAGNESGLAAYWPFESLSASFIARRNPIRGQAVNRSNTY